MTEKAVPYKGKDSELVLLKRLVEATERIASNHVAQTTELQKIHAELEIIRRDGSLFRTPRAGGM